jgi:cysteine desulfurase/selenocysteine lyase
MRTAMETQYANVHRGLHWMRERTTDAYEAARDAVAALLNARDRREVVFTRNITESLNLMAHSYGRGVLKPGQAVLISGMEHHSNIIPWQLLRDERMLSPAISCTARPASACCGAGASCWTQCRHFSAAAR